MPSSFTTNNNAPSRTPPPKAPRLSGKATYPEKGDRMQKNLFLWRLSRIYVWLFPFTAALVLALRFGVPVAYSVVAIDLVLLGGAVWVLVAKVAKTGTPQQRTVLTAGVLLVAIVGIISLIFPLGPPPRDPAGYLATRVEQEFRYTILMIS